jgi:AraC-like DNA-binding protein
MGQASRLRFARDTSGADLWKLVYAAPAAALRGHVLRYCGYVENTITPMTRRELPFGGIPLIINLGPALRVAHPSDQVSWVRQGSGFMAGLHDTYVLTETCGAQRGVQIDFSPIGAARFLDRPLRALSNEVVDLETLMGPEAPRLIEQLDAAPGWAERFALLDRAIARRVLAAQPVDAELAGIWQALQASAGTIEIGTLAAGIGWSRKHLIQRFTDQFGLPPKRTARILRFNRAVELLRGGTVESWTALALDCGFYDQAHMIRDFHRFSGSAPADFLARQLPDGGGVRGD